MSKCYTDKQRFDRIKSLVLLCSDKSNYCVIKSCALVFANVSYLDHHAVFQPHTLNSFNRFNEV